MDTLTNFGRCWLATKTTPLRSRHWLACFFQIYFLILPRVEVDPIDPTKLAGKEREGLCFFRCDLMASFLGSDISRPFGIVRQACRLKDLEQSRWRLGFWSVVRVQFLHVCVRFWQKAGQYRNKYRIFFIFVFCFGACEALCSVQIFEFWRLRPFGWSQETAPKICTWNSQHYVYKYVYI